MKQHFVTPDGLAAGNGFSHAVAHAGRIVFVSGQVPLDSAGNLVGSGDPEAQIRQVFSNLTLALAAAGASVADVLQLTIYLTDLADLPVLRRVRDEFLDMDRPPASTLVQVNGLVNPEYRVEIDAVAGI